MIDKIYQPSEVEGRIYAAWEKAGAFRAGRPERAKAEPFCVVIPPPNVTGSLHMGHALNNTLQDLLCRFERMRGKDVLWQPGTDHAGIATQMVVERQLMEHQQPGRREMGREAFLKRVWEWKAESGGTIINQLKRLGASCDWSRERFTMDEGLSRAVVKVFVALYREGLIYKDKRLVNWDPKLLTAISDLEVVQVETKGHLWHLRYPLEGQTFNPEDPSTFIVVATTRPETMLGDTAVAVHPDDERYKEFVDAFKAGQPKKVILPLVGRPIPIIADEYSDPAKGTGAVKITPAHDFNDFEVGKRRGLDQISIFTPDAKLKSTDFDDFTFGHRAPNPIAPDAVLADEAKGRATFNLIPADLRGLDRSVARKRIVEQLEAGGFVSKIEPHTHVVPHGDRSNVVIEPYLTDQWYVNAKELAKPAIAAVRNGRSKFVPQNWQKTYFDWMENIQPWCISRQLWWGHQIPVWYGTDGAEFVETDADVALASAIQHYESIGERPLQGTRVTGNEYARSLREKKVELKRDEDVLDTWFSSALWPFSTLGWPDETPELKRYYPTSVLVTGFDIIFFWVARMMMMGLHFMKEVPFHDVYIHALVRDASGAKMSKSKGNVIDPLAIIDDYGADALRFTLAAMAAQGRDIKLSPQRVEGYRNFATKLWNASRFAEMNGCARVESFDPKTAKETLNRWIAHETAKAAREITSAIEAYKFNDAAAAVYRFVWNIYCDWYLELSKPVLTGPDSAAKTETQAMVAWARDEILKLLHPFMPFITEELWGVTAPAVIPGRAEGANPESRMTMNSETSSLDSGPGASHRPGMTKRDSLLALTPWPNLAGLEDAKAEAEIGWVIDLVNAIRSVRSEMNVPSATQFPLLLCGASAETKARAGRWSEFLQRLARVANIEFADAPPPGSVQLLVRGEVAALPLKGLIDLDAERARLEKEMVKVLADISRIDAKLSNADFVARAPEEVVDTERERREEAEARRGKILEALERLKGAA
ncbi:MAG: valyl-tRNA synthetase [Alphaproteobacteria bacterium]|jgi:valyl-tRNA synthetase|nr:valyl-tRNA synthetase [Alphaproteobacteria bacterium]